MLKSRNIKCPQCGAMIEVTNPNGLAIKEFVCPNSGCKAILQVNFDDGETILAGRKKRGNVPGQLQYKDNSPLIMKVGRNTVGRKDSRQTADLGCNVDDMTMSRLHCQIEVAKLRDGEMKAVISDMRDNEKIKANPTIVDGEPLSKLDRIVLDDGDYIKMGKTIVRYAQI